MSFGVVQTQRWLALIALSLTLSASVMSQETTPVVGPASVNDLDFFEKRVRPLLVQRCFECHSAKAEKLKGGL